MSFSYKHSLTDFARSSWHRQPVTVLPKQTCRLAQPVGNVAASHGKMRLVYNASRRLVGVARVTADGQAATQLDVTVEEVMNPHPILLKEDMNIKEAVHKLLDANVSGAPVVNQSGHLVGVLTEADVIWKGAGQPEDHYIIPPVFIGFADAFLYLRDNKKFDEEVHKILARTVSEAMAKGKIINVTPSTAMSEAAHLMLHHDVNLLPVVEVDGRVVGIVTRHDILRGIYASKSPLLG